VDLGAALHRDLNLLFLLLLNSVEYMQLVTEKKRFPVVHAIPVTNLEHLGPGKEQPVLFATGEDLLLIKMVPTQSTATFFSCDEHRILLSTSGRF
jgi:hypothetical protein